MSFSAPTSLEDPATALRNKKSRIIPPERRKKVAKACDSCKRRKQKCNGDLPCGLCTQKNFDCTYTGVDKRNLKPSRKSSEVHNDDQHGAKKVQYNKVNIKEEGSQRPNVIPPSLQPLFHFPIDVESTEDAVEESGDQENKNEDITLVPEEEGLNSRLLYDTTGHLRYIGESSPGPFLAQCRRVFSKILGVSKFTHDPERFSIVDSLTPRDVGVSVKLPEKQYADYLVQLFKTNVSEIIYVLNDDFFDQEIYKKTFENPQNAKPQHLCLLYLILAIGSLYWDIELRRNLSKFSREHFVQPQLYYHKALKILHEHQSDCNLWLVEAHLLMCFYDELSMTRNSSWINLGISIRYAQGLGMHRKYVNDAYKEPGYALHRRKLFRSLYIMDRASSTHLGRSLTISDLEWDDKDSLIHIDDLQNEMLKVSNLSGKILSKVYYNPSIGMKNALKLAVEMKNFTINSSIGKNLDFRNGNNYDNNSGLLLVHVNHLNSVILLSRPFFFFVILIKLKFIKFDEKSKNFAKLMNFYQSCIKASTLLIKLVEYHFNNKSNPLKAYTVTSSLLHAGAMLGLVLLLQSQDINDEFYGNDQDKAQAPESSKVVCVSSMKSVIKILAYYGEIDPTPKRYSEILANMLDATKVHRHITVQESARRQQQQQQQHQEQYQQQQHQLHPQFKPLPQQPLPQQAQSQPNTIPYPGQFPPQGNIHSNLSYSQPQNSTPTPYQQNFQAPIIQHQQQQQQINQLPVNPQPTLPQPIPTQQLPEARFSQPQPQPQPSQGVEVDITNLMGSNTNKMFSSNTNQRFEDWLFPKFDSFQESSVRTSRPTPHQNLGISPSNSSSSSDRYHSDDLIKDLSSLNNISNTGLGNQFIDDFLFNVIENNDGPK
ncbi:Cutinase transcription factor 1 alpha [Wickerhamomyces ciferrii]|uniref:Cutinase transcription factor 1 alpha n=1 Tax=Wickerhamomyces ciferrii (strain ATCC 14091 / BCRC 22168 / CBS 111 / JCM 3599 / NBRC 0793 / NRRL Y-1031 F-60-10) TaxID=1206466 RepID=K0K8W3_WICCF|nr:Cutinase transcription factor 1 alpha [Wickerhamomyces ciferrii]CCH41270.1 Cutinase transcription factor 1 alpha [Wickerhamomyces ciferrii]